MPSIYMEARIKEAPFDDEEIEDVSCGRQRFTEGVLTKVSTSIGADWGNTQAPGGTGKAFGWVRAESITDCLRYSVCSW